MARWTFYIFYKADLCRLFPPSVRSLSIKLTLVDIGYNPQPALSLAKEIIGIICYRFYSTFLSGHGVFGTHSLYLISSLH